MRVIDKFLTNAVSYPQTIDGKILYIIKGTNPKTGEEVHLQIETENVYNTQMFSDTIKSALEEHLGLKYDYQTDSDQQEKLNKEMEEFLSLPQ